MIVIPVHRLNNSEFTLNADLVETIESTPDTVITLISGKKLMVKDSLDSVVQSIIKYKQLCNHYIQVVNRESKGPEIEKS
jgi:flagellar protein FlbD